MALGVLRFKGSKSWEVIKLEKGGWDIVVNLTTHGCGIEVKLIDMNRERRSHKPTVLVNKSPANPALRLNAMFSGIFNSSYV